MSFESITSVSYTWPRIFLLAVLKKEDLPASMRGNVDAAAASSPPLLQDYFNSLKPKVAHMHEVSFKNFHFKIFILKVSFKNLFTLH